MGIQLNGSSGADIISSSDGTITINGTSTVSNPIVTDTITISDKISHTGDSNTHIRFAGDDTVTVETAGSERLRINSSGKTFIHGGGATSANNTATILDNGNTLNIHGTSSSDGISVVRYSADYGAYGINIGKSRNSSFGTNTLVQDGNELGHISFYGADGTNFEMAAQITGLVDGDPATGGDGTDMPGALSFRTTPEGSDSTTERFHITSDGKYYFPGTGGGSGSRGLGIETESVGAVDEGVILNARASGTTGRIKFQTNSATAMTILGNGGNIGIGTDIPGSQLHLYSATPGIRLTDTDTSGPIHTNIDGASGYLTLDVGSVHRDVIISSVNQSNEIARFEGDGNVLIGGNIKTNNISGHNIIHNGAFNIAQRGVGISSTATGFKTVDRWRTSWGGNSAPISQKHQALTSGAPYDAGFRYSYRIESTGHSGNNQAYCYLVQSIEARDIANSGWQYTSSSSYINLSFWIKANVSQNYLVYFHTNDTTIKEYCFLLNLTANQWTKVTKAVPGNSGIVMNNDNGVGLQIWFAAYLGDHYTSGSTVETWQTHAGYTSRPDMGSTWWTQSNATFEVTGVQLELGSTDTPFEHRPYEEELRKCQRYFYSITPPPEFTNSTEDVGIGWATSGTEVQLRVDVPVVMRDTPTVEQVQGSNYFRIAGSGYGGDKYLSNNWLPNNLSPNGGNLYTAPDTNLGSYIGQTALIQLKNTAARLAKKSEI